jgi:dihydropteroate synthase
MKIDKLLYPLPFGTRTFIMGIINVTPDSFSGDGLLSEGETLQAALNQADRFVASGADILDIGGESTRPGAQPLDVKEELERILPVIKALRAADLDIILSIDTYKAKTADTVLKVGADWINDVFALKGDPELAGVVAMHGVPIILMHNRSEQSAIITHDKLGNQYKAPKYKDLLVEVKADLQESITIARRSHIEDDRIILDPGLGFGKTVSQNLELINHLDEIKSLGFPVLMGPSRKSFIGHTLDLPPNQRVEGTAATVSIGIARGADIVRVHDVEAMTRVARMTDAIVRKRFLSL